MVTHVAAETPGDERGALLSFLEAERGGIRRALIGLTPEQATSRPSASELSLAGLLKHVAETEQAWIARAKGESPAVERDESTWHECFALVGDETVASQLAYWEKVAAETEAFILVGAQPPRDLRTARSPLVPPGTGLDALGGAPPDP